MPLFLRALAGPLLLAFLAACSPDPEPKNEANAKTAPAATAAAAAACSSQIFEGTTFSVCKYDSRRDTLELRWKGANGRPLRSLAALQSALGPDAERVRFAMNAGMYDEEAAPIGLYVENGEERVALNRNEGPGNFHLLPNGVFAVDEKGRPHVVSSDMFRKRVPSPLWATQSGPMLVINGKLHPKFDANGSSRLVRNGVGVRDARTAFFVIAEEGVSFGRFARFPRRPGLPQRALPRRHGIEPVGRRDRPAGRLFGARPDARRLQAAAFIGAMTWAAKRSISSACGLI